MLEHLTSTKDRNIFFPVFSEPVRGLVSGLKASKKKMLTTWTSEVDYHSANHGFKGDDYRDHTKKYLSVVNENYRVVEKKEILLPLQEQMVNYFDPTVLKGIKIKDTILKDGAVCWSEYTFPDISQEITAKESGHKTKFNLRYILKNTFDGSGSVMLYSGDIDTFCTNGMISGSYDITKKKHTKNFNTEGFLDAFDKTLVTHKKQVEKYQKWADTFISAPRVRKLLENLTKSSINNWRVKKKKHTLSDRLYLQFAYEVKTRGQTVFALTSAMSAYASHNSTLFPVSKAGDAGTLLKRQERVGAWLNSDHFKDMLEHV